MNIILEELYFIWNGGPGSGNFNPGQGRGVGKPSNQYKMSESFKEVFDEINSESNGEFKKEFDAVIENFRKNGIDTSKVKFVASKNDIPKSKREQLENDSVKGMTFANKNLEALIYVDEDRMFDYGIDARTSYKEGKQVKDQPWATDNSPIGIIKHELGHVASYTLFMNSRGRKGTTGPIVTGAVRLDISSRFKKIFGNNYDFSKLKLSRYGTVSHGEAVAESFANPDFSEDTKKIYDYYVNELSNKKVSNSSPEKDDWIQLCEGFTLEEISKNSLEKITSSFIDAITSFSEYIEKTINGGKGSGNFNPGQGRGKGKPSESYTDYYETEIPQYFIEQGFVDASNAHYFVEENADVLYENNVKTEEQKQAISDYTRFAYTPINSYLRGDKNLYHKEDEEKLKEIVKIIDSCFNGSLNKNIVTYRAMRFNENFKKPKEGDIIENKGYSSTSINPESIHESLGRIVRLKVKKGTKALYIDENTSNITGEKELLFPRNMKIKITKDYTGMSADERYDAGLPDGVYYDGILYQELKTNNNLEFNGGPGSGNFNPGQGRGVGKPADNIDVSKYSTYEDFEQDMFRGENRKENIEKLKEQGINSKDKMYLYFVNEKFKKQKITQMSLDEAKDTILENIPKSVAEGWFIKADSSYKKKIVQLIVENDNLRSASLSLAYETYKELVNKNIGFNDFLNKELDLYRGDPEGKKFIEADSTSFISYTPFEDMAKKFGKVITKKTIKPKETLGVLRQVGEFEFLVPTFNQKKDVHKSKNASVRMNDLLQKMDKILNGGPNSGNHNPGQGRGVGKPNNSPSKIIDSYKEKYSDFWLNGVGDNGFETATRKGAENYRNIVELIEKQKDIEWGSGEYDRMTERIMDSQDEIENNFKTLCENNLTEHDFYKIKNLFYDWSTNLGPRGNDGLFLDTPGIILEKDSEAFGLYKAYIQTILYELGVTSKKLFRGEPKKFDNKPKQFISYTDSMASAVNFAHGNIDNVIVEEIPINKIVAVDDMMNFSGYRTEKEWIVDSGIYE